MPPSTVEHEKLRRGSRVAAGSTTAPVTNGSGAAPPTRSPTSSLDLKRLGLSLGLVLGLIVVARFAMRRLFPAATVGRSSQVIKVLSRSVLAPKQQFLLLQVGRRLIVVGDSGASMNALAEISDPDEVAALVGQLSSEQSAASSVATFGALFRKSASEFEKASDGAAAGGSPLSATLDAARDASEQTAPAGDPHLERASGELSGLMERVKLLSSQLRRST